MTFSILLWILSICSLLVGCAGNHFLRESQDGPDSVGECPIDYCKQYQNDHNGTNACLNGGACINMPRWKTFRCACQCGWYGRRCEDNPDDCHTDIPGKPNPCLNGGTCIDGQNTFHCQCPAGYAGVYCADMIDYCQSFPCQNGGTCEKEPSTYHCNCPKGWTGIWSCAYDIDECAYFNEGSSEYCDVTGTQSCSNTYGSYSCACKENHWGSRCEYGLTNNIIVDNPDGMQFCDEYNVCDQHGACFESNSTGVLKWTCFCSQGYSGPRCEMSPSHAQCLK